MFENWDKYDQKGIGWTCRLQSFQEAPTHGTGNLAPAHGTGLRNPRRVPPRSLLLLRAETAQPTNKHKQAQTQNKMSSEENENRRNR